MSIARTWYVPCSPRSPEKIIPELEQLAKLEGANWNEKDTVGQNVNQVAFAHLLEQLETFEGSISERYPAFSARDRFAPMKTLGFAFVDSKNILRITLAGQQLIERKRTQEMFLKQMLKWQYPSWQHGGNKRTRHLYLPSDKIGVFPFVETLRVCSSVGGLSKQEIAMFLLPLLNASDVPSVIQRIQEFRAKRQQYHGRQRKEFDRDTHQECFCKLYAEDIASGRLKTRESLTKTPSDFITKKIRNSFDVADAALRYFRATGLFTLSANFHGIAISPLHEKEVARILNEMTFKPVDFYDDVEKFYEYMGNPRIPQLPWENRTELMTQAINLGVPDQQVAQLKIPELKDVIIEQRVARKEHRLQQYMEDLQSKERLDEIIDMFGLILSKEVVDPPLFLEWNVWRALVALDDFYTTSPHFVLDEDLQPFSTAPGNRPDLEIAYNDTFVTLVEVTLSRGARQYDTESEPITRHIGRFQQREHKNNPSLDVYGLFIAPRINPAAASYFYVHLKHLANPDFGGYLNIVPLTLDQFIAVFRFCKTMTNFHRGVLKDLFERVVQLKDNTDDGMQWLEQIPIAISEWHCAWRKS